MEFARRLGVGDLGAPYSHSANNCLISSRPYSSRLVFCHRLLPRTWKYLQLGTCLGGCDVVLSVIIGEAREKIPSYLLNTNYSLRRLFLVKGYGTRRNERKHRRTRRLPKRIRDNQDTDNGTSRVCVVRNNRGKRLILSTIRVTWIQQLLRCHPSSFSTSLFTRSRNAIISLPMHVRTYINVQLCTSVEVVADDDRNKVGYRFSDCWLNSFVAQRRHIELRPSLSLARIIPAQICLRVVDSIMFPLSTLH